LVAMAEREREVRNVEVTHISTMAVVWIVPAWAVMKGRRRKRITPRMFCMQGRYTPNIVPSWGEGMGRLLERGQWRGEKQ